MSQSQGGVHELLRLFENRLHLPALLHARLTRLSAKIQCAQSLPHTAKSIRATAALPHNADHTLRISCRHANRSSFAGSLRLSCPVEAECLLQLVGLLAGR